MDWALKYWMSEWWMSIVKSFMNEWYIFLFYFLSAPTTQDQTPSSAVSVATPTVSVSTPAPTATPVQTVPQPHPQTLPPAVPHSVPQPAAAIPAFPPVMVPPFRVPLPGMPIPLPGNQQMITVSPVMFSYCQLVCSHVSVTFEICLESHLFETFLKDSWLTAIFSLQFW